MSERELSVEDLMNLVSSYRSVLNYTVLIEDRLRDQLAEVDERVIVAGDTAYSTGWKDGQHTVLATIQTNLRRTIASLGIEFAPAGERILACVPTEPLPCPDDIESCWDLPDE